MKIYFCSLSGAADVYNSKWFGYPYFDFLKDKNKTGDTQETIANVRIFIYA